MKTAHYRCLIESGITTAHPPAKVKPTPLPQPVIKTLLIPCLAALISLTLPFGARADITTGLVGYWNLNEGSGATAGDSSGNGNTGTLTSFADTTYTTMWTTNSWVNNAVVFNQNGENSNYISIPDSASIDAMTVNKTFTLSAWVKCSVAGTAEPANAGIITKGDLNVEAFSLYISGGHFTTQFHNAAGSGTETVNASNTITAGVWNHVVVTVIEPRQTGSLAEALVYVNGTLASATNSNTYTTLYTTNLPTLIGSRANTVASGGAVNLPFEGTIDEVRLYSRALTAGDIFQLYTNSAPAPTIATQPRSVTCYSNDTAQFVVGMNVHNLSPISYQWQLNGVNLPGATAGSLTYTNVTAANAGSYTVIATNYAGSVTSSPPAVLTVLPLPAVNTTSGLVGWWKLDDASGSATAADSSGNGNAGALTGFTDTTYDSMWGAGIIGGALTFNSDGTSSNLVAVPSVGTPAPAVLDFSSSPEFSLSAWVNASLVQSNEAAILAKGTGNGGEQYVLELNGGDFRFFVRDTNDTVFNITSAVALNGHWQHVAAVLNATNGIMNLYVNGALAGSGVAPFSLLATNHELSIGNRQAGTAGYGDAFSGVIDDVRIYNRSLSAADVFALYSAAAFPIVTAQSPVTYTNLYTLYAGASPTFKILSVTGLLPLSYHWFTNGVADAAGTNATYQLHNLPVGVISNYCIITNSLGSTTSYVWTASVVAAPSAPYPQTILGANPLGYWRLNEPDDGTSGGDGEDGVVCHDYLNGNDGIYTNSLLAQPGYTANNNPNSDPAETSAAFGAYVFKDSDALGIGGINFATPTNTSAAFSVEAWVNAYQQNTDAGIVSLGYGGGGEQFDLDTGSDNSPASHAYRFLIRDASGASHGAASTIEPVYGTWHHLVGVCDEANSNMTLYVDGAVAARTALAPGSGILASTRSMIIGSRPSNSTTNANDYQFAGNVNEVAVYNYALSSGQVAAHYAQAGTAPGFSSAAPTNSVTVYALTPLSLPVTIVGTPPMGYQWFDDNGGTNVISGVTNGALLNAGLNVASVPAAWNGDTLQLTVTNAYGTLNYSVNLSVLASTPVITNNLPLAVSVPTGKSYTYSLTVNGAVLTYQWYNGTSPLAGQTNATYSLTAGSPGSTSYFVVITNVFGATTSSVSTFTSLALLTNTYATNILGFAPVGYWPLQETNPPAPVTMETNYGTLGRLANAFYAATNASTVTLNQPGALAASGDNDTAAFFSAPNASASITNINSYAFVPHATPALTLRPPLSLECWVNSSEPAFGDILGEGGGTGLNAPSGSGNWGGVRLSWGGNPTTGGANIQFYVCNGNGTMRSSVGTPQNSLSLGQWHHCVATYDGTNTALYVDGVQLVYDRTTLAGTNTMVADAWSPFTIGGAFWQATGPQRELLGGVDEVAVYTNVLTTNQVSNHYLAATTAGSNYLAAVTSDQPLLYYRMDCAGYVAPNPATFPTAVNYGSSAVNGAYVSGTVPGGVSGPALSALGTNSVASPGNGVISCVDAGYDPLFNRTNGQPFTVMTWFRSHPADGRVQAIMSHGTNWAMNLDGTTGHVVWNLPAAGAVQAISSSILNDGNWHFVAGVYDGSTSYLYVDGTLNGSEPATGSQISDTNDVFLGGNAINTQVGGGQRYFAGDVAQAAFYTNALSGLQIQQIASLATPVTPTVSVAVSGGQVVVSYTGTLVSATNVAGPYSPVTGASSPYSSPATNSQMFFKTHQ